MQFILIMKLYGPQYVCIFFKRIYDFKIFTKKIFLNNN